jgi:hypothetical protein
MQQLRQGIDAVTKAQLRGANTPAEVDAAFKVIYAQIKYDQNELEHWSQAELLARLDKAGATIPAEHYKQNGWPMKTTLTDAGEVWGLRELKKLRREEIEFWAKLVLPVVALIVSIIALATKH